MNPRPRRPAMALGRPRLSRPVSKFSTLGLAIGLALALPWPHPAQAQESATANSGKTYDIPAGSLESALKRFGREAGILLSFPSEIVDGKTSPGLHGHYTTASALQALLRQSGLEALPQANGGYLLRKVPMAVTAQPAAASGDTQLAPVKVTASAERSATTEQTGSYTTRLLTIGKMEQSIRETPQSVTVITRQQMDDQNLVSVEDVIAQTTGTSKSQRNFGAHVYTLRGFEIADDNYLIDGVSRGTYSPTGWVPMDTAIFDRVEVLRGAGALAVGVGDPSGVVNMVRKRPRSENHLDFAASVGSWDNYRAEIDTGGPLNEAGTVRGRIVTAYQDRRFFYDVAHSKQPLFYGVIDADLSRDTKLTVGVRHQEVNIDGYTIFGLPRFTDGKPLDVSRSTALAQKWNQHDSSIDDIFVELEQRLGGDWRAKLTLNHGKTTIRQKLAAARGAVDPLTLTGTRMTCLCFDDRDINASALDANVTGSFDALGGKHQAMLGLSWSNQEARWKSTTISLSTPVNIYDFNHSLVPEPATPGFDEVQKTRDKQLGIYGSARLQLAEPLHLLLGGRVNWYDYHTDDVVAGTVLTDYKQDARFTPYTGLVYDLDRQWSLYASYANTFVPQSQYMTITGNTLKPAVGANQEAGVKGELLNGKLNVALALFSVRKRNVALFDAENSGMCPGISSNDCYRNASLLRSKGIDLEIAGELARGWQVATGYTQLKTRDETGESISSDTPRKMLRASTSYRLPGDWERWTIGGALSAQSGAYVMSNVRVDNPGRAILDLRTAYKIDSTWTAALNVGNVTDRTYWSAIGGTRNGAYYGTPRNFMLSLRGSF